MPTADAVPRDGLDLLADSLALEILAALDAGPAPLARIWSLAHERLGRPAPSRSLALAERAVRSLLSRALVVLVERGEADVERRQAPAGIEAIDAPEQTGFETTLGQVESWTAGADRAVAIARSA
jgi:hypothetical protein